MTPERTCVGCHKKQPATSMLRVVIGPTETLDVSRVSRGRGAWICSDSPGCFDLAVRHRAFQRALRREFAAESLEGFRSRVLREAGSGEGVGG